MFTTSIPKQDVGADYRDPVTPKMRRASIKAAVRIAVASFGNADLCPIRVVNFEEWAGDNQTAARITLDIGGNGFGGIGEVVGQ